MSVSLWPTGDMALVPALVFALFTRWFRAQGLLLGCVIVGIAWVVAIVIFGVFKAGSGVPSGTRATLTSETSSGASPRPVSSSSATSMSSSPPAACSAGTVMPR